MIDMPTLREWTGNGWHTHMGLLMRSKHGHNHDWLMTTYQVKGSESVTFQCFRDGQVVDTTVHIFQQPFSDAHRKACDGRLQQLIDAEAQNAIETVIHTPEITILRNIKTKQERAVIHSTSPEPGSVDFYYVPIDPLHSTSFFSYNAATNYAKSLLSNNTPTT